MAPNLFVKVANFSLRIRGQGDMADVEKAAISRPAAAVESAVSDLHACRSMSPNGPNDGGKSVRKGFHVFVCVGGGGGS